MRIALWIFLVALALSGATWSDLKRAANQAAKAGDYAKLKELLLQLRSLAPGNSRNMYNLAASEAKLGNAVEALAGLKSLAAAGLIYDITADEDFNSLAAHAEFAAILARFEENKQPVTHARLEVKLAEADAIPESIVYDRARRRFLVGSVRKARVVTASGKLFAQLDWPAMALAIDAKRSLLWVATGWLAQCESCSKADEGKTTLLAFDLATGLLKQRVESPVKGVLGDMTISRKGEVFVSEGIGGVLLRLPAGAKEFERLSEPGEFPSPQTPALSPDERTLYVPDYIRGIAAIDLVTRAVKWLQPAPGIALSGIDGLYLHRDKFIAVQNGTSPPRLIELSRDLQRQRVLEAGWAGLGEPTHGEIRDGWFYFLTNSGWDKYDARGGRKPGPPVVSAIYKLRLK